MAEASNARELVEAQAEERDADFFPLNDLPNDVLVSVFAATDDPNWVRRTFPLVCKAWAALYDSKDASPLHETLDLNFHREAARAKAAAAAAAAAGEEAGGRRDPDVGGPRPRFIDPSKVLSWAERRTGSVRKLSIFGGQREAFSLEDLCALVAVVGPSLTDISISHGDLCTRPFWESLRTSVVPAGRLRSLVIEGVWGAIEKSDVKLLGQLAGSLEELVLSPQDWGLRRFPKSLLALKELRRLRLSFNPEITAIPAGISSLTKLKDLEVSFFDLSSLPKELAELSGLTQLDFGGNENLGTALPAYRAFPAELGRLTSLRQLDLRECGLRTVPSFVGKLKSLESLNLLSNSFSSLPKELGELSGLTRLDLSFDGRLGTALPADEAFPAELGKMKSLRVLNFSYSRFRTVPVSVGELESLERLNLSYCQLSYLPEVLGELSALTKLDLGGNENLGTALPAHRAFPAELRKLTSLRELSLHRCGLSAVPAFVGKLESLEVLDLYWNDNLEIETPLDFLLEGCPRLREVSFHKVDSGRSQWTPESRAHLEAFEAKLRAKNPDAEVRYG